MADEWWSSSVHTGDEAACSTAPDINESAVGSTPMSFSQPSLSDAADSSSSSSSFLLAGQHMDYWTQDFMGGRASAAEATAATASFNTLLQLQGDAASHRLLLEDQAAALLPPRHLGVPGPYGGDGTADPQGLSPYEADNLQQQSLPGLVLGSSEIFGQPATEPPQFLLQALEPRFLKSNTVLLHNQDVGSPATRSSPGSPAAAKKPRIEAPSPLPTFKVRKEKLGDRITALQQLVSPFGKVQKYISAISFLNSFSLFCITTVFNIIFTSSFFLPLPISFSSLCAVLICSLIILSICTSYQLLMYPIRSIKPRILDGYRIGSSRGHRIHQVPSRSSCLSELTVLEVWAPRAATTTTGFP